MDLFSDEPDTRTAKVEANDRNFEDRVWQFLNRWVRAEARPAAERELRELLDWQPEVVE